MYQSVECEACMALSPCAGTSSYPFLSRVVVVSVLTSLRRWKLRPRYVNVSPSTYSFDLYGGIAARARFLLINQDACCSNKVSTSFVCQGVRDEDSG